MKNHTTLITGCTSGIGLHLAREFADHGHDLILVAPNEEELLALAHELATERGVNAMVIPKDLEREGSAAEIFEEVQQAGIQVGILVNNAGQGFRGKYWDLHPDTDDAMINLNIRAVLRLTRLFLPAMVARGRGRILNTASIAGFEPGPTLGVYHATKAFVLSWSEALAVELKDTGVKVTILCPGPTDTDFFPKADMVDVVAFQKGNLMAPQDVAKAAYQGLADEDLLVVPGVANKLLIAARRFLSEEAQASLNEKMYRKVPPEKQTRQRGDMENKAAEAGVR